MGQAALLATVAAAAFDGFLITLLGDNLQSARLSAS